MKMMVICIHRLHLDSATAAAPESYLWQSQYGFGTIWVIEILVSGDGSGDGQSEEKEQWSMVT